MGIVMGGMEVSASAALEEQFVSFGFTAGTGKGGEERQTIWQLGRGSARSILRRRW